MARASRRSSTPTSTRSTPSPASSTSWPPGSAVLEAAQRRAFQRVGLVRYNPFEETGGNQSFALALLDAEGDGWVLSSLHARSGTRVYAKADQGAAAADARLSDEEIGARSGRRRPDRLAVTAADDAPVMAPTTARSDPTDRRDPAADAPRREPVAARSAPGLARARAGHGAGARDDAPPAGLEALLGGLNPDQLRAVTHGDGPLLVVAGAGTGKTQVITRRIAWLIATRRAKPSEILALTFTDKAAEEMAVRVDQLVRTATRTRAIATFHAFGDRLIREYALELGLPTDLRVLTRRRGRHLPARAPLRVRPRRVPAARRPDPLPGRARDAVQPLQGRGHLAGRLPGPRRSRGGRGGTRRARRRRREPTRPRTTPADAAAEEARRQAELAGAYATYQELLAANGCIDFGDQVALALRLVRDVGRRPGRAIAGRFRYILVDEFQDTNRAQAELVAALADGHRNVTVVGDDDQAIYAFRGAAVDNILAFQRPLPRAPGPSSCAATTGRSRRSSTPRTGSSGSTTRTGSRSGPGSSSGSRPQRVSPAAGAGPARGLRVGRRGGGLDRRRDRPADRGRRRAPRPRDPRPRQRPRRPDPAGAQHGRHPVAVLGHVRAVRPARGPAAARVPAGRRRPRIERRRVRPRGVRVVRPRRRGPDRDRQHGAPAQPLGLGGPRRARPAAGHPARSARRRGRRSTGSSPTCAATRRRPTSGRPASSCTASCARAACSPGWSARTRRPPRSSSRTSPASSRSSARSRRCWPTTGRSSSRRTSPTLIEAGDDPATAELDPDADAVAVLTVHKAKGLEFPVVFLPGHGRRPVPVGRPRRAAGAAGRARSRRRRRRPSLALAEERRLCYVAMTRARDELILSHAADYGGARARRVSPFVLEALDLPAAAGVPGRRGAGRPRRSSAWRRSRPARPPRSRRAARSPSRCR